MLTQLTGTESLNVIGDSGTFAIIASVKAFFHKLVSTVLLLGILLPGAPLDLWHEHHESGRECETHDHQLAQDACHNRIYHHFSTGQECHHKAHLTKEFTDCDYCKFFSSHNLPLALHEQEITLAAIQPAVTVHAGVQQGTYTHSVPVSGRAPPMA